MTGASAGLRGEGVVTVVVVRVGKPINFRRFSRHMCLINDIERWSMEKSGLKISLSHPWMDGGK